MAKPKPIECPKCGSTEVVAATDKSGKQYCQKCQHVWVPGMDPMKREDLALAHYKKQNFELQAEIDKLRKDNSTLQGLVTELRSKLGEEDPAAEDEIFS